jgi:DNA-binding transcriptional ArsR family regulator
MLKKTGSQPANDFFVASDFPYYIFQFNQMKTNTLHIAEQEKVRCRAKADVLKALAHPVRLWIVEQLAYGECCVCQFVDALDFDFSTISKHLSVLKQAGIVEDDKRGKQVFYRLKVPCVLNFMTCIEAVIKTSDTPPSDSAP